MDCGPIAQSKITSSTFHVPLELENHFKKSPHSSCQLQVELEVNDPLPLDSSIQEELSENRAYLSPLASRAALASIMSKLPQKLEFSVYREEENGFNFAPDNSTGMHVTVDLSNCTKPVKNKLSSEIEAAFVPDEIFKSFATAETGASRRTVLVETSSEIANPKSLDDACISLSGLVEERELRQPSKSSSFTPSEMQKDAASSASNAEMKAHTEEIKSGTLTNRRLTRSAVLRQGEDLAMEVKERLGVNNSGQGMESNSSEGNVTIPDEKVPKKKKPVSSPRAQTTSPVTEDRNKKRKMPGAVETTSKAEGLKRTQKYSLLFDLFPIIIFKFGDTLYHLTSKPALWLPLQLLLDIISYFNYIFINLIGLNLCKKSLFGSTSVFLYLIHILLHTLSLYSYISLLVSHF